LTLGSDSLVDDANPRQKRSFVAVTRLKARKEMKRRTLDIMFSIGGFGLAGLLVVLGLVLTSNANFSRSYVTDQLSQQKITFTSIDKLTPEDKAYTEARTGCVINFAGQPLTTGKQAECYANEYIGGHLTKIPAGTKGLTFAEIGKAQTDLKAKIAVAKTSGDPGLPGLEKQLADYGTARETVFKGEMLRGALLTSYGFSELGVKAGQGAWVAFLAAALLALLSVAGIIHAFVIPKNTAFAPVEVPEPAKVNGHHAGQALTRG
jgi:hypothetical protein